MGTRLTKVHTMLLLAKGALAEINHGFVYGIHFPFCCETWSLGAQETHCLLDLHLRPSLGDHETGASYLTIGNIAELATNRTNTSDSFLPVATLMCIYKKAAKSGAIFFGF
jgi:hypothetical protein